MSVPSSARGTTRPVCTDSPRSPAPLLRTTLAAVGLVLAVTGGAAALARAGASGEPVDASPPALDGAGLFAAKGCATCHDGPGSLASVEVGPSLAGATTWAATRRPGMDAAAYLRESMRNPSTFRSPATTSDAIMPVLTLDDDEIDRLVAHLLDR